jgi:hypothetical protein
MTQSLAPPRAALVAIIAVVVLFGVVWGAIALATAGTEEDTCQSPATSVPYNGTPVPAEQDKCQ